MSLFPLSLIRQLIRLIELHPLGFKLSASFTKSNIITPPFPQSSVQFSVRFRSSCLSRKFSLKSSISCLFKESMKASSVQTEFSPFPFENVADTSVLYFVSHTGLPNAWEQIWVPHGSVHAWMSEWVSTYFALLRKQWWKSTVPLLSCRLFQTHPQWSRGSCRDCLFSKVRWSECARCWLRWETWAHNLWEGSAERPKSNSPYKVAVVELAQGQSSEGVVMGLGASVGNGVENGEEKKCIKQRATEHGWDGMTLKKVKTQYNSIEHLEPWATCTREKYACVASVRWARCGVLSTHTPSLTRESSLPVIETLWKKTKNVQVFHKQWLMVVSLLKRFIM